MNEYLKRAEAIGDDLSRWRRELHRNPELSMEEYDTAAFIERELRAMGVEDVRRVGETGVTALLRGDREGKTVALRADIDALPCEEKTDLPFRSERKGFMHACGHDVHAACLLGAAKLLRDLKGDFAGQIRLLFQPGEEKALGAKMMVENGVLDDPAVDAAAMLHCWPGLPAGTVGAMRGTTSASSDKITIEIRGKQGHGAHPQLSVDGIFVAGYVITALHGFIGREVAALENVVLSLCRIEGGNASNVIAGRVLIEGSLRTLNPELQRRMHQRIREVAEGIAQTFRASATVSVEAVTPVLSVDDALTERFIETAKAVVGEDGVHLFKSPSMGSEDFAFISERVPAVAFRIGTGFADEDNPPLHSDLFRVNERCLPVGTALLCAFALDVAGR